MDRPATLALTERRVSEETVNQWTHGFGLLLSVLAAPVLLGEAVSTGGVWCVGGSGVYVLSLIALYAASTLSHSFRCPRKRSLFRLLDQVCIFLLIAGTFTPFALVHLRDGWWALLPVAVWVLALAGIAFKVRCRRLTNIAASTYVLLGWMPLLALKPLLESVGPEGFAWALAGGLFYTAGTFFLARDEKVPYFHAVWHLMVVCGSACHFWFTLAYVVRVP